MASWVSGIPAITLFVEDVAAAREFYSRVFEADLAFEDEVSAAFKFGPTIINLLQSGEAVNMIAPASVGAANAGTRAQYTLTVEDVDATAADLERRGVTLLNGPVDQPWGIRTACFADPDGNVWEITKW